MEFVKIRSWHVIRTWTRVPGRAITLCGRSTMIEDPVSETLPAEKSCETCLRIVARRTDAE